MRHRISEIAVLSDCEMSRRDGAIVAWHEVPGTAPPQESRPVGYGVIRAGVRADSRKGHYIEQQLEHHRTRAFQEEYLASVKRHGPHFDEKYLWDSLRPIIPYPTGRFSRDAFPGTSCQATIGVVPTGHAGRHFATALAKYSYSEIE
jgi:hypothetical protein